MSQKTNYRKHGFMFSPPLKMTFDVFGIHLVMSEINNSLVTSSFDGSLVDAIYWKDPN